MGDSEWNYNYVKVKLIIVGTMKTEMRFGDLKVRYSKEGSMGLLFKT